MAILGIGTDIVECPRIGHLIERHGEQFITRVYTDAEIAYCSSRKSATQHYAGRWAAKEAVLKALGTGWRRGISWSDVEIRTDRRGRPVVVLHAGAREAQQNAGVARLHVTISHCRFYAVAYAIAEGDWR